MNSIVADYVTRQKIPGTHLKYNIFKQITLLQPGSYSDQEIAWVTRHVVRLCCSSDAMSAFARDMGSNAPPEPLEDDARRSLRAELDAFFAWKYGLSKEDLRYILDPKSVKGETYPSETFRGLREKEENIFKEYRTQRLVLEAWTDSRRVVSGWKTNYSPRLHHRRLEPPYRLERSETVLGRAPIPLMAIPSPFWPQS